MSKPTKNKARARQSIAAELLQLSSSYEVDAENLTHMGGHEDLIQALHRSSQLAREIGIALQENRVLIEEP